MKKLALLFLLSSSAVACDKGCAEYEGNCACDQKPVYSDVAPSDEKAPTDKIPSYQREGIHVDEAKPAVEYGNVAHDYVAEKNQK